MRKSYSSAADWDGVYRGGTPPWDHDRPRAELVRVLDEYRLKPRTVLEMGCGTGADAIELARRRFEVTAVDCSPIAVERARLRAEQHDALLRFVQADIFEFGRSVGPFDLVYESGLYHAVRRTNLEGYLDLLWRVTRPGSHYLSLSGAPGNCSNHRGDCPDDCASEKETASHRALGAANESDDDESGPPRVSEEEIHAELGRLFEFIHLRPIRLETADPNRTYPGWSCLMRRPAM